METVTLRPTGSAKVHESTVAAMSVIGSPTGPVCKVHMYTDGSFKEAEGEAAVEAAWAFVVILEHTGAEYSFQGLLQDRQRSEMRTRVLLLGLGHSKQEVIQRNLLVLHESVGGVSIECVLSWA